jgi:hypothetical protein
MRESGSCKNSNYTDNKAFSLALLKTLGRAVLAAEPPLRRAVICCKDEHSECMAQGEGARFMIDM